MTAIIVYSLPQVVNLTMAPTPGANLMNYASIRSDFRVTKGVTTEIHFFVRNVDRQPVVVATPRVVITTADGGTLLLEKTLVEVDPVKAIWMLSLRAEEVVNWPMGSANFRVLLDRADDHVELYTDRGYGQQGSIEVAAGPYPDVRAPLEVTKDYFYPLDNRLFTGALPGGMGLVVPSTLHGFALYGEEFVGDIIIQASLEDQPSVSDTDWFAATSITMTEEFPITGAIYLDAAGAFKWVRVVVNLVSGNFTKVLYQN